MLASLPISVLVVTGRAFVGGGHVLIKQLANENLRIKLSSVVAARTVSFLKHDEAVKHLSASCELGVLPDQPQRLHLGVHRLALLITTQRTQTDLTEYGV